MNILLIGNGYIGSAFVERFQKHFHSSGRPLGKINLTVMDFFESKNKPTTYMSNDRLSSLTIQYRIGDYVQLNSLELSKYDCIILLAGSSSVGSCFNMDQAFDNNVIKFQRLLSNMSNRPNDPVTKLIYASSASVYGNTNGDMARISRPLELPKNNYDATKQCIDIIASQYKQFEIHALRFGTVCGWSPNMRWELMINAMYKSAIKTKQIIVTNGHVNRAILNITDLIDYVIELMETNMYEPRVNYNPGFHIHNLASFNGTIKEIAKYTAAILALEYNHNVEVLYSERSTTQYDFKMESPLLEREKAWNHIAEIIKSLKNAEIN